ncbi:MAG TPA: short-chain dehydrogenase, partial [Porticoccaceae bacterium]|nr:short-chain dehydrogenase [Porticoccaceae bacterium]
GSRMVMGSIVNIVADIWRGMPGIAHTCAARAGVVFASRTVAVEWAPYKIRVNCVAPGTIAT